MNKLIVTTLLVLAGCAPSEKVRGDFSVDCVEFKSEVTLDVLRVEENVAEAKRIFDTRFGQGEFCKTLNFSLVTVRRDKSWQCLTDSKTKCLGFTSPEQQIELNYTGSSLVHEVIHVYEMKKGLLWETHFHEFWELKGYEAISDEYSLFSTGNLWLTP